MVVSTYDGKERLDKKPSCPSYFVTFSIDVLMPSYQNIFKLRLCTSICLKSSPKQKPCFIMKRAPLPIHHTRKCFCVAVCKSYFRKTYSRHFKTVKQNISDCQDTSATPTSRCFRKTLGYAGHAKTTFQAIGKRNHTVLQSAVELSQGNCFQKLTTISSRDNGLNFN